MRWITAILMTALMTAGACPSASAQATRDSALLSRGSDLMAQGRPDAAESLYRQALAQAPDWAVAWYYLGTSLMAQREYDKAEESFDKALDLNSRSPQLDRRMAREATDAMGLAAAFQKDFARSRRIYAGAIEKDPAYPAYPYNLACVSALSGDRKAALEALGQALMKDRGPGITSMLPDPSTDEDLAGLRGDPVFQALLIRNLQPQPGDGPADGLVRRGAGLLCDGDLRGALETLKEAVAAEPAYPPAWFYLAGALDATGEKGEAAEAFLKSLAPGQPGRQSLSKAMIRYAGLRAGTLLAAGGSKAEALGALDTAAKADPGNPWVRYETARVLAAGGDAQAAATAICQAFDRKDNLTALDPGLPDPRLDPAFSAFTGDAGWKKAVDACAPAREKPAE